jgi:hypothetical protein
LPVLTPKEYADMGFDLDWVDYIGEFEDYSFDINHFLIYFHFILNILNYYNLSLNKIIDLEHLFYRI